MTLFGFFGSESEGGTLENPLPGPLPSEWAREPLEQPVVTMINDIREITQQEWLEADGLGGFASGTVSGIRTRRYHALLLTATKPPVGRMVLVNGFDAVGGNTARHICNLIAALRR